MVVIIDAVVTEVSMPPVEIAEIEAVMVTVVVGMVSNAILVVGAAWVFL